jgi:hypothetical protein
MRFLLLIPFFVLAISSAHAEVMHCVAISMTPGLGKASLMAKCDGAIGHVDNKAKAEKITIRARVTAATVKAFSYDKPHFGIADYFPLNDDTRTELQAHNGPKLNPADQAYVGEFTLPANTPLYQDEDESAIASLTSKSNCGFEKRPSIASTDKNPDKICMGHVRCGAYQMEVACSASLNGGCPSAERCVDDTSVRLEKAKVVQVGDEPGGNSAPANGAAGAK